MSPYICKRIKNNIKIKTMNTIANIEAYYYEGGERISTVRRISMSWCGKHIIILDNPVWPYQTGFFVFNWFFEIKYGMGYGDGRVCKTLAGEFESRTSH